MDDRDFILNRLKKGNINKKPPLPRIESHRSEEELTGIFMDNLKKSGGAGRVIEPSDIAKEIGNLTDSKDILYCTIPEIDDRLHYSIPLSKLKEINKIDITILQGLTGVAENGAVWIDEEHLTDRRVPFISDKLLIILSRRNIYYDLSEAYEQIHLDSTGFGLLIAGPSKTADIEQSLVIGAQGAKNHTVLII